MRGMRIEARLALTFGVIVLLLMATVGFTVMQMYRLDRVQDARSRQQKNVMLAMQLKESYLREAAGVRGYVLIHDDRFLNDWREGVASSRDAIGALHPIMATSPDAALFEEMLSNDARYNQQAVEVLALAEAGQRDAASAMILAELLPRRLLVEDSADRFVASQRHLLDSLTSEAESVRSSVRQLTIVIGSVIVLLSLFFAYTTTRAITRPIRRLADAANAVSRNDFVSALALVEPDIPSQAGSVMSGRPDPRNELVYLAGAFASMATLVQRRQNSLANNAEFAEILSASLDLKSLTNASAAVLARALRCEVVAIYLLNGDGVLVRAGSYAIGRADGTVYRLGAGLPGQAASSRQRIVVTQIPADTPYVVDDGVGIALPRTLVAVPLLSGADPIGSMVLASLHDLDEESLAFVDVAAQQMGVALSNARAHEQVSRLADELRDRNEELAAQNEELQAQSEEIQAQYEELQAQTEELQSQTDEIQSQNEEIEQSNLELRRWNVELELSQKEIAARAATIQRLQDVSQRIASSLSLRETLDAITSAAETLSGSSLTAVLLLEPDGCHLRAAAWRGFDADPIADRAFHLDNTIAGQVIRARELHSVTDSTLAASSVVMPILAGGEDPRAILAAPMIAKDEVIGVVEIYFAEPRDFSPEETEFLSSLAHSAAVAVLNARLHERLLEQYAQLQVSNLQAQEAARLKSAFLSSLSHELRTPLHSVLSLSEMLLQRIDGELTLEQVKQVEIIRRNGQMLLSLINDVLDLSKIEAGRVELRPTSFDLTASIHELEQMVRPLATSKGLTLGFDIDADVGQFWSDEERVRQILANLLSNAVKFTERGGIAVRVQRVEAISAACRGDGMTPGEADGLSTDSWGVRIKVTDTGIGIPEGDREIIFEAFRQSGGGTSWEHGGTGLGLTIARNLARLLGGEIEVHSAVGEGSAFVVSLPCLLESEVRKLPKSADWRMIGGDE